MPRKTFIDGEPLPASEVNDLLMDQAVQTYATSSARNTALPLPKDGQVATNGTDKNLETYYDRWRPLPFAMEVGGVSITAVANTATAVAVTWAVGRFTQAPYVFCTVDSGASAVLNSSFSQSTTTGANIVVLRSNAGGTNVRYMAVQMKNGSPIG